MYSVWCVVYIGLGWHMEAQLCPGMIAHCQTTRHLRTMWHNSSRTRQLGKYLSPLLFSVCTFIRPLYFPVIPGRPPGSGGGGLNIHDIFTWGNECCEVLFTFTLSRVSVCTCTYAYLYQWRQVLTIWGVSIHAYPCASSFVIVTQSDWYGYVQLYECNFITYGCILV